MGYLKFCDWSKNVLMFIRQATVDIYDRSFMKTPFAEPYSSVGSVADLKTEGCWFDPRLGQYSFRGLMLVIATGFIPLSLLSIVSTMIIWEGSQGLGKNILRSTV